jgi:uncharacterized membrane protein YjgN (DUF898 family)
MPDEAAAHSADGARPANGGVRVGYAGKPRLIGLLVKNFFLTLITIGFYRFWARARLRRYFWSNILIAGEPLEYTGTGLELFLGFLVAVAIMAPLGIVYVIARRVMLGNPVVEGLLALGYFVVLLIFVQVVVFRARRYRLSRTAWRGIYAGQTGSAWRYLALSLLYGLLMVATLGLAAPWRNIALERYKIDHSWFGESRFSLDARARDLFPRWLIVMAIIALPMIAAIALNLPLTAALFKPPHPRALWLLLISLLAGVPALIWYWVAAFRYIASRTTLGAIKIHSAAKGSAIVKTALLFGLAVMAVFIVMLLGFAGLAVVPYKAIMAAGAGADRAAVVQAMIPTILPAIIGIYVIAALLFQIISYRVLRVPIIRHLATTVEIENLAAVDTILQSAKPRQKLGIADSFDLGAI